MNQPIVQGSIALNATYLASTTNNAMATPVHRLPVVMPGRYRNASSQQLVEVDLVDAKGVHYRELPEPDSEPTLTPTSSVAKSMNTAVFALSHLPV